MYLYQFYFYSILIMKFDINKIINIKNEKQLYKINPDKPLFYNNYLFHYLIIFNKLELLKKQKHPIYEFNEENLDGFMLATKYNNMKILKYLLLNYKSYSQNHNSDNLNFINYFTSYSSLLKIIKKFPDIDWEYLFKFKNQNNIDFYCFFISQLNYNELIWFNSKYNIFPKYDTLIAIIYNTNINNSDKIKIFNTYSIEDINNKDYNNQGLIITLINLEKIKLIKYFIKRGIDLEYIIDPILNFYSPFHFLYKKLTLYHNEKLVKIMDIIYNNIKLDYDYKNKYGINYLQLVLTKSNNNIDKKIDDEILKNGNTEQWNYINQNHENALFYIIKKPFNIYKKYIENIEIDITIKNKQNKNILEEANLDWQQFLKKLKNITPDLNLNMSINKYQHYNKFNAKIIDIIIYFIYLSKKYSFLYIPCKMKDFTGFYHNFPFIVEYNYIDNTLNIHPDINTIINTIRRDNTYDFALLFLGLTIDENLNHANILLYDFKNLTIERFEPYGRDDINNVIDSILDEELTWNTGFNYLKPNDFMTKPGFQLLADENDMFKMKLGDFGGFCLGWCIWYVEHRLKNPQIKPIIFNKKIIEKLLRLDDSFIEYIRNYSNKLFNKKFDIISNNIHIVEKDISNLNITDEDEHKIINFAKNFFNNK